MCLNLLIGTGILLAMTVVWFVVYYWLTPHLDSPDAQARITGACGETMEIRMCFEKNKLVKASHWLHLQLKLYTLCHATGQKKNPGRNPRYHPG